MSASGEVSDDRVITTGEVIIQLTDATVSPHHIEVAAGHDLHFTVVNTGKQDHTFSIEGLEASVDLAPGETKTVTIETPPLGEYRYGIDLERNPNPSMTGTLVIFI